MSKAKWRDPGMKRVRLLLWRLFVRTPLKVEIGEWVERGAARHCGLSWPEYCQMREQHADLWRRYAEKRAQAKADGGWRPQPPQLAYWRYIKAKQEAHWRKPRPRFTEWAMRKLLRQRGYKQAWRRNRVVDRISVRFLGL